MKKMLARVALGAVAACTMAFAAQAAAIAARPDLDPEKIKGTSKAIADRWCVNGCMNPVKIDDSVAFVYANPDFKDVPVLAGSDLVDLSFTTKALELLGVDKGAGMDGQP